MKILYVNPHDPKAFKGHKTLDRKMIELMSNIGEIDVISHEKGWYSDISEYVKNEYYVMPFQMDLKKEVPFHIRLYAKINDPVRVLYVYYVFRFINNLNNVNNYDCIYFGALDWCTFALSKYLFSNMDKIYLVVHNTEVFNNFVYRILFYSFKNKINYAVTEKCAVDYFIKKNQLEKKRVHYIPHPLIEEKDKVIYRRGGYMTL